MNMRSAIFLGAAFICDAILQTVGKSINADISWKAPVIFITSVFMVWDLIDTFNRITNGKSN
jgi:hypothetical protein